MENDTVIVDVDTIIPQFLYLGSYEVSQNENALKRRNIKIIINCTPYMKKKFEGIEYHHFRLLDNQSQDLSDAIEKSIRIIEDSKNLESPKPILVHCEAGVSRSASIVIAYIMKSKKMNYSNAHKFVQSKRYYAYPNAGFVKQLKKLEKIL